MIEDGLFARRPMGMRVVMVICQQRAAINTAITDTDLTQSSWTVLMQLYQLGGNVLVNELTQMQGIELSPLICTLSQPEKRGYLLHSTSPYDRCIRLLALTTRDRVRLNELNRMIETYQHRVTCTIPEAELASFGTTFNQIACDPRTIREGDNKV